MKMLDQSTVTVPIYDIVIDSHINTRELDEAVIEEYRESMREYGKSDWQRFWNESPRMTESRHLYSGFHTVTAAMREFGREYEINVIQEGKDWRGGLLPCHTHERHPRPPPDKRRKGISGTPVVGR